MVYIWFLCVTLAAPLTTIATTDKLNDSTTLPSAVGGPWIHDITFIDHSIQNSSQLLPTRTLEIQMSFLDPIHPVRYRICKTHKKPSIDIAVYPVSQSVIADCSSSLIVSSMGIKVRFLANIETQS